MLIDGDESQVEQRPGPAFAEILARTHHGPAIIFLSFPETDAVSPFAGKVHRETESPKRGQRRNHNQSGSHPAAGGDYPGVGYREQTPEFVHLAIVARKFSHDKAVCGTAAGDDSENLEGFQLVGIKGGADKEVKNRAGDNGQQQKRAHQGDVHLIHNRQI